LIRLVTEVGGRTVAVQPDRQIVSWILAWVTPALIAPGVQPGSGNDCAASARRWQVPGAGNGDAESSTTSPLSPGPTGGAAGPDAPVVAAD
jgi:hypothetical protein